MVYSEFDCKYEHAAKCKWEITFSSFGICTKRIGRNQREHDDNCPEKNKNYGNGHGLQRWTVQSWEACSDLCSRRSDCQYWTWHHDRAGIYSHRCKTMTMKEYERKDRNCVSGTRACRRASYGVPLLLANDGGYKYYKIPVPPGTRMNVGVVTATCKAQGMSSVCLSSGCKYNSPGCKLTPLSTSCDNPMVGLMYKICGSEGWVFDCSSMDGLFTDTLNLMRTGNPQITLRGACGSVPSVPPVPLYCAHGDDH